MCITAEMHVWEWKHFHMLQPCSQALHRFLLLAVWKSGQEPGIFLLMSMTHMQSENGKILQTNIVLHIVQPTNTQCFVCMTFVPRLDTYSKLPGIFALLAVLSPHTHKPFLPFFYPDFTHVRKYTRLSSTFNLMVPQKTESWVGAYK